MCSFAAHVFSTLTLLSKFVNPELHTALFCKPKMVYMSSTLG